MFGFRKLFDISCMSDYVQPISKPLSVVLAECGHFVVTWSVQEYSYGHLVCSATLVSTKRSTETDKVFYINSLLTVQFNVPQKCLKPNTELLKTCVNAMK